MRIFLTAFFVFSLYAWNTLEAQYLPIPDTNAIWSVFNEKYYPSRDSTINGKQYTAFYLSRENNITTGSLFAFLRQDTTVGKVFTIPAGDTTEYLLYDFSLEEGDTARVYQNPARTNHFNQMIKLIIIDSIDSVTINGEVRRRLGLKINYWKVLEYWIEGIGSTAGLFNSGIFTNLIADASYPQLICFEEDGQLIYNLPEYQGCYMEYPSGGSVSEATMDIDVSCYPNPVSSVLRIKSSEEMKDVAVYSINGKKLLQVSPDNPTQELDLSVFQNGMYLLEIRTRDARIMRRLIKTSLE